MNTERTELIKAMRDKILEDMRVMSKAADKALEANKTDDFINISKRIDKLMELRDSLRTYEFDMIGFDYKWGKGAE